MSNDNPVAAIDLPKRKPRTHWSMFRRAFVRNPSAMLGGTVVLLFMVMALFAPLIAPYHPYDTNTEVRMQAPSREHLAGTDRFGRDIFSRIVFGTRISLQVGFTSVLIALAIGGSVGLLSGYYGGRLDSITTMLVNMLLAFPPIMLALLVITVLGPGMNNVTIAVGVSMVPQFVRLVRGSVLSAREEVYVEAARAMGTGNLRTIVVHILPNIMAPLVILSTLNVALAILVGASMSFLGLGAQPPEPEWGSMVNAGRFFLRDAWWLSVMPGTAIMLLCLTLNLLGDGLRDSLDPRLRT